MAPVDEPTREAPTRPHQAVRASTSEGAAPCTAKDDGVPSPAPLQGLQDWYLRASDGEWDRAPGIPVDPLDAARAWAQLPVGRPSIASPGVHAEQTVAGATTGCAHRTHPAPSHRQ